MGEAWTYTCTLHGATKSTTKTARGDGRFTFAGVAYDVTWCTAPSAPPQGVFCDQAERGQATVTVKTWSARRSKAAVPTVVTTVVYTYSETNDGNVPLSSPSVDDTE